MILVPPGVRILLATRPVGFRKGMDGLAALVQQALRANPFQGDVFVFRARRVDRVKILVFDGTGLALYSKRLEAGRFCWPSPAEGVVRLTSAQLATLLEGLAWQHLQPRPVRRPSAACRAEGLAFRPWLVEQRHVAGAGRPATGSRPSAADTAADDRSRHPAEGLARLLAG